ncbi:hypothetical protein M3I54_22635 [Paraburkholderia sp. CNPSo 3274]|uniref:hypothetical protein n=1 Tax=Paraburkholderia sp. CNPSo 3274 TaxID=2940932 RepID=UPI0020B6610B|nr:hypothetical protein [Paraburkholderia sp. CNPSo 3274]MCP3709744.1 hypothetical protein [Paraburkholderia sp. CNPSo 3274]
MDRIDELLLDWYTWSQGYNPGTDYQAFDSTTAQFRSSRQWMEFDDLDAEVEWALKKATGRVLEPLIQKLDLRARVAVNAMMRNFESGAQVWSSVRLGDGFSLQEEYDRAKAILCPMMVAAGLLEKSACKELV